MKKSNRGQVQPGRPRVLWDTKNPPLAVETYFNTFMGETSPFCDRTNYPYAGAASAVFRLASTGDYACFNRPKVVFNEATWVIENSTTQGDPTADLFAAAELLGASSTSKSAGSGPNGGYSQGTACAYLLDGLVFAAVDIQEDQWDNSLTFTEHLLIAGPWAYRALLELLGFNTPRTLLPTERRKPSAAEVRDLVDRLLAGEKVDPATL